VLDELLDGALVLAPPDVELLSLLEPPHAASAPLASSRAAVSAPHRRILDIGTGIGAS
jgi:hypothetical protein